jgi:hypothetical protein
MDGHLCQETELSRIKPVLSRQENASEGFRALDLKYTVTFGQTCLSKSWKLPAEYDAALCTNDMSTRRQPDWQRLV